MRINRILKTTGFLTLFGISVFLSVSLSAQLAQSKGKFPLLQMAESEGWCQASSIRHCVYAFYNSKDTIVLFDEKDPTSTSRAADAVKQLNGGMGYKANYPQISFLTLVAVENDGNGRLSLYDGGDGNIRIKMGLKLTGELDDDIIGYIGSDLPYHLVNLTDNNFGLYNVGGTNDVFPDSELRRGVVDYKKGFFLALGDNPQAEDSLKAALSATNRYKGRIIDKEKDVNILDAPRNSLEICMGESDGSVVVIAVKTWNYKEEAKKVLFKLENPIDFAGDLKASIKVNNEDTRDVQVDLSVDNINFERLKDDETANGDYPGEFVVKGTGALSALVEDRLYRNIIALKVAEAKGLLSLESGCGPDPIQVAAVYIYNNPPNNKSKEVFNLVRHVVTKNLPYGIDDSKQSSGEVDFGYPVCVMLNPFKEEMRFNAKNAESRYAFVCQDWRDATCFHEALHCYHLCAKGVELSGDLYPVYDKEPSRVLINITNGRISREFGDKLYVGPGDTMNEFLKFSYDHKNRGFLNADDREKSEIISWLKGIYGDKDNERYMHGTAGGVFITNIYDGTNNPGKLSPDDVKKIFKAEQGEDIERLIPTEIPPDLPPLAEGSPKIVKIYIYKPPDPADPSDEGHMYNCGGDLKRIVEFKKDRTDPPKVIRNYGYYEPLKYSFKFKGYTYFNAHDRERRTKNYTALLTEKGYQLYVLYGIRYKEDDNYIFGQAPYEYDAAYFMITHGE